MSLPSTPYIGRFAPSPSGPLHIGSLVTALASYLDARANRGQWLLRMEDIDPPREQAGAAQIILNSLINHGLKWDGDVFWQSQRSAAYEQHLNQLFTTNLAYWCACSRRQLAPSNGLHTGACRHLGQPEQSAIRLRIGDQPVEFNDRLQGPQIRRGADIGDPILKRKDGLYAYQLAVVVDDAAQGITDIVRGVDLLDASAWQIHLQKALGLPLVRYCHIPVIVGDDGHKLSKQSFAPALDDSHAFNNLCLALRYLQQTPPPDHINTIPELLNWAAGHWQLQDIPAGRQIPAH
ncbi:MAG: tRNA glutamyl-Q(34) synthetase GluQRS [Zhongshania sp.]|uniref:tRNA glutamyl-Q(34) synthetase GluQRS n=1 Tax=Zhongshania sp. TaxID=1971902 RepID=UPI00261D8B2F|nr:tRNA glutamyl-Q(34) synthetase GluQRS [Zhongshania sp.]MDF1693778.1 tRNA glutamyl-Q(34) synthetase GluQRS [Zhongshania sp.]